MLKSPTKIARLKPMNELKHVDHNNKKTKKISLKPE